MLADLVSLTYLVALSITYILRSMKCIYLVRESLFSGNCLSRNRIFVSSLFLYSKYLISLQFCVISPWLFNVYMDGVAREVNVRVPGKWLQLLSANGSRFEINQLLFADDTALVADSEEKLCRLVNEFGRVCERRKLTVNVGKSKVMRCSRYGNGDTKLI